MDGIDLGLDDLMDDEEFQAETRRVARQYLDSLPKVEVTLAGWYGPSAVTEMIERVDEAKN